MSGLNPEVLTWARETAGLDLETAARKISLANARGLSGADRLAAYERGEGEPTPTLLRRMASQYRRPLVTFYMPYVPAKAETGQDFRTLPDRSDPSNSLLEALLRDVKARQSLAREQIEDDEYATPIEFVGAYAGETDPVALSAAMVDAIKFDRRTFRSKRTVDDAFAYLRERVEECGVFVLLAGDCGSWQTAIDVNVFRGFAIADKLAPFIVVNDQDARTAWSFTLLHELAHLLLGQSGVSGDMRPDGVERICNDAAAATLLDLDELGSAELNGDGTISVAFINELADKAKVSRTMVAYRLYRVGNISSARWEDLRDSFRAEWQEAKARNKVRRDGSGGPDWYIVRRHRIGRALISLAREGLADGSLTPVRAGRMLGVKPTLVYPLLSTSPKRAVQQ